MRVHRWLWLAIAVGLLGVGTGQELEPYLRLRKQYRISGPTPSGALDIAIGKRVLEVEGIVRGYSQSGESLLVYLEVDRTKNLSVSVDPSHQWIRGGQLRLRMLVEVSRESEYASPEYRMLGAVYASTLARWEAQQEALRQVPRSQPAPPPQPRPRGKSLASRSKAPTPPPISNWQTFQRNLEQYVPYYRQAILKYNPRLAPTTADQIARAILVFSLRYGVDPRFIMAIVLVESGFNPSATSRKGAMGLGQLMPGTARGLGVVDPYDPIQNLEGTVRLVRGHLIKYWSQTGDPDGWDHVILALAAYNAGSGAVRRYGGVPPYKETQNYIRKVIRVYKQLCGIKE